MAGSKGPWKSWIENLKVGNVVSFPRFGQVVPAMVVEISPDFGTCSVAYQLGAGSADIRRDSLSSEELYHHNQGKPSTDSKMKVFFNQGKRSTKRKVKVDYNLKDPKAFAQFVQDANIGLVRFEYLKELAKSKRPLPRRQEADMERFRVAGEEVTALVSHEEIESLAKRSQNAIICSISHAWETREHPDPCRYQLELINSHASLFDLAFVADIWIFYDYVSLYQFERETDAQRENFGKAMGNMHVMYAHESTLTFRIESLTPDDVWEAMKPKNLVPVWHVESRKVVPRGLKDLVENRTPYTDRGWCKAEIEWSSARSENAQNQQIDLLDEVIDDESELSSAESEEAELKCRVVRTPEQFRIDMETSKFTHRSDAECVVDLQEKIFFEKVTACEDLVLKGLPVSEIIELAFALPHYKNLKSIRMENFRCGPEEAKALGQALARSGIEKLELHAGDAETDCLMAEAIGEALKINMTLTHVDLSNNLIGTEGLKALVEALKINKAVTQINLSNNNLGPEVAKVLAEVLDANATVMRIELQTNFIGPDGAKAIAEALKLNKTVTHINLSDNNFGVVDGLGPLQAIAEALKVNTALKCIHLSHIGFLDEGAQVIAEALMSNRTLTCINLSYNKIWPHGAQAIAAALRANYCLTDIILRGNFVEDEGAKDFADTFKVNKTMIRIDLSDNNIGPDGAKVIAEAAKINKVRTFVNLSDNEIGPENAEAHIDFPSSKANQEMEANTNAASELTNRARHPFDVASHSWAKAIAQALKANNSVTHIKFFDSDDRIGPETVQAIAEALKYNRTVTSVKLCDTDIGVAEAKVIAEALMSNTTMMRVDLHNSDMGPEGDSRSIEVQQDFDAH
eukprot:symbB.v1.2.025710.t2/scaffold2513.1/size77311/3